MKKATAGSNPGVWGLRNLPALVAASLLLWGCAGVSGRIPDNPVLHTYTWRDTGCYDFLQVPREGAAPGYCLIDNESLEVFDLGALLHQPVGTRISLVASPGPGLQGESFARAGRVFEFPDRLYLVARLPGKSPRRFWLFQLDRSEEGWTGTVLAHVAAPGLGPTPEKWYPLAMTSDESLLFFREEKETFLSSEVTCYRIADGRFLGVSNKTELETIERWWKVEHPYPYGEEGLGTRGPLR